MTQLDLIPDDITIARQALEAARLARSGRIGLQAARLYDAVHRDLRINFPAPTDARPAPSKPGYVKVRSYERARSKSPETASLLVDA